MAVVLEQWVFASVLNPGNNSPTPEGGTAAGTGFTSATAGNLLIATASARWGASGPVGTLTPPSGFTEAFTIDPMEAHTAVLAYKVAAGGEDDSIDWSHTGTIDPYGAGLYEFSGITTPVLDKTADAGSGTNNVTSIATGSTGTLGASAGLAFVIGLNRRGAGVGNGLAVDGTLVELFSINVQGGAVAYWEMHAWEEFSSNAAYNPTVSTVGGGASRMGAGIATFIAGGGGGGQTVAINQVTETDAAQAVGRSKLKAVGQSAETDSAQAIARSKAKALGQASETDLAQALVRVKAKAIGQATETDTAQQVIRSSVVVALAQVSETNTAQALAHAKARAVAQAAETDLAQAITHAKARAVVQAAETDLAQAIAHAKARAVAQATETDLAQAVTHTGPKLVTLGQAAETDTAQAFARIKAFTVGQVSETDLALALGYGKALTLGIAISVEEALTITREGGAAAPVRAARLAAARTDLRYNAQSPTTVRSNVQATSRRPAWHSSKSRRPQ